MARKEASHSGKNKMRQRGELLRPWITEVTDEGRERERDPRHTQWSWLTPE